MSDKRPETRRFHSNPNPISFAASQIDAEGGILRDVVMVQEGEASGHGVHLEAEFVTDIVKYSNKHFKKVGLRARFGHPEASENTMGKQLGRFFNVRERKGENGQLQAIGDLHLLESSNISPDKPGMKDWVISMAAEAPDFLMSSIVFQVSRYYQRDTKDKKYYIWEYVDVKTEDGETIKRWKSSDPELGNVYIELADLYYTDLVETGAATTSLFSNKVNDHLYVAQAGYFFDANPHIETFLKEQPEKLFEFLSKRGIEPPHISPKSSFTMNLKKFFFGEETPVEDTVEVNTSELSEMREKLTALQTQFDQLNQELNDAKATNTNLTATISDQKAKIEALQAEPAATPTQGATGGTETQAPKRAYHRTAINRRVGLYVD